MESNHDRIVLHHRYSHLPYYEMLKHQCTKINNPRAIDSSVHIVMLIQQMSTYDSVSDCGVDDLIFPISFNGKDVGGKIPEEVVEIDDAPLIPSILLADICCSIIFQNVYSYVYLFTMLFKFILIYS